MHNRLHSDFRVVQILRGVEKPRRGELLPIRELTQARSLLRQSGTTWLDIATLRSLLAGELSTASVFRLQDDEVLEQVAWKLYTGYFKVAVEHRVWRTVGLGGRPGQGAAAASSTAPSEAWEAPAASVPAPARRDWIRFRVVDEATGSPLEDVQLAITLPDGTVTNYLTDVNGLISIEGIDPGVCDAACDIQKIEKGNVLPFVAVQERAVLNPAEAPEGHTAPTVPAGRKIIARVEEHKVKTGESMASLAREAGLPWQALAEYNWGTSDPAKINDHLRDEVGCRKTTADGKNFLFDDTDDPGLLYIPRPWKVTGRSTGRTHTIVVNSSPDTPGALLIVTGIRADEVVEAGDLYTLESTTPAYPYKKTLSSRDDQILDNDYIDLEFTELYIKAHYTLTVALENGERVVLLEDVPYSRLGHLSDALEPDAVEPA